MKAVAKLLVLAMCLGAALALGAPVVSDFMARTAVAAATDALLDAFHVARMEALARNAPVTVCKSPDADAPFPRCATSAADWSGGWIVFVDRGSIGVREAGDDVISAGRPAGRVPAVTEAPGRLASITFHPVGPVTGPAGTFEIHLAASLARGSFERVICLSILGRAHVAKSAQCHAKSDIGPGP